MRIDRLPPEPQQPIFTMEFPRDEGWVIVSALYEYSDAHPDAVQRRVWKEWANDLTRQLRL
jgi:hypothetical protein